MITYIVPCGNMMECKLLCHQNIKRERKRERERERVKSKWEITSDIYIYKCEEKRGEKASALCVCMCVCVCVCVCLCVCGVLQKANIAPIQQCIRHGIHCMNGQGTLALHYIIQLISSLSRFPP